MIFLRYESPKEYIRLYPVTTIILLINIALYVAMWVVGSPYDKDTLIRFGAHVNVAPFHTELWRYIAAQFLHIGFEHLLFNSFSLFVFAAPLERLLGKLRYIGLYLGSGIAGGLLSQLLSKGIVVSAGASGGIYGVFAAFAYLSWLRKDLFDQATRKTVITILIIGFVYSFMPQVNLFAHLGGFIGGFLILHIMLYMRHR